MADRWQVSLKTLRRWRFDGEGPVWHKVFRHVRYHEADDLEFERSSAQHLMRTAERERKRLPRHLQEAQREGKTPAQAPAKAGARAPGKPKPR